MKILIVGGAGFSGSWLAETLLRRNHQITILDVVAPSHAVHLSKVLNKIDYLWKSVHDISLDDITGHDVIVDFAAQADTPMGMTSPGWTAYNNVLGLFTLMETCRKTKIDKFVYAGSGTIFGRVSRVPIDEEAVPAPTNPYSASKACAETICMAYHRCYGIPVTIVRNGMVYGPRMRKETVIAKFLAAALNDEPLMVEGGEQTRDPNYTLNMIDAFVQLTEAPEEKVVGEVFHIGGGEEITIQKLAETCISVANSKSQIVKVPYRPGETGLRQKMNIEKAKRVLQYRPRIKLCEGLKFTLQWLRDEL